MPAIVGPIQVVNLADGMIQFGDCFIVSPKTSAKSISGSGAENTGAFIIANNLLSSSNGIDTNLLDQPILGNN